MVDELRPLPAVPGSRPINRVGETTGNRLQEGQISRASQSAKHVESLSPSSPTAEVFGTAVPPEIGADPVNRQTEWGWRRFLMQTLLNEQNMLQAGDQPELLQKMTQILWEALSPLLPESLAPDEEVPIAGWMPPGALLPFSALQAAHFRHPSVPEKVKRFAMAEKLRLSVRTLGQPVSGGGLFYPPVVKGEDRRRAVYWQAKRQTVADPQGKPTEHLFLTTEVNGKALELLLTFARPTLSVHIRTKDEQLRQGLDASQDLARVSLKSIGWDVSQFSVGAIRETEGEI